MHHSLAINF